jgi:hypothetical protein
MHWLMVFGNKLTIFHSTIRSSQLVPRLFLRRQGRHHWGSGGGSVPFQAVKHFPLYFSRLYQHNRDHILFSLFPFNFVGEFVVIAFGCGIDRCWRYVEER